MDDHCHTDPHAVLAKKTLTCPDHDTIAAAFKHETNPKQCTVEECKAMDYFLNYVLPCFDINLAKNGSTDLLLTSSSLGRLTSMMLLLH
jgi:hypothetical protein